MKDDNQEQTVPNEADEANTGIAQESNPVGVDSTPQGETEPATLEDAPAEMNEQPAAEPTGASTTPLAAGLAGQEPHKIAGIFSSKKQAIAVTVVAVALAIAGVVAYILLNQSAGTASTATEQSKPAAKMGLAVTVVDGTATYQAPGSTAWAPLTAESKLSEGAQIKTAAASRVVLAFDDGSALRLDENTTVELKNLAVNNIQVEQLAGVAYSRVVASERSYVVLVDGVSYKSLGTAFSTLAVDGEKGVRVFQSQVDVSGVEEAVAEGKQYFAKSGNAELAGKTTDIDVNAMANDAFVKWNLAEDEKTDEFKQKLGVLSQVKQRTQEITQEEARQKADAEAQAKAAAEAARLEAERRAREAANAPTAGMSVRLSDGGIFWEYAGTAASGFKVVYSSTNTTPSFGQSGTTSVYVDEPRAQFLGLPKEMKEGKTYYVRVCAYYPNDSAQPCRDYSNVLRVN